MRIRLLAALCAAAGLLFAPPSAGAAAKPAAPLVFEPPAGNRAAGLLDPADPYSQILPSGRLVVPEGASVAVGMNALGVTLTPDGRFALVSNCDEGGSSATNGLDPRIRGGYSLAVVETATMRLVEQYRAPGATFFAGIVAFADPLDAGRTLVFAAGGADDAVAVFDLDGAGHLVPDRVPSIAMPLSTDAQAANAGRAFPASLVASKDGTRVYVVNDLANDVTTIDVASRTLAGVPVPVGYFPFGAARAGDRLLVANEGLASYRTLATPVAAPEFRSPKPEPAKASSLSVIPLAARGLPVRQRSYALAMDRGPDGSRTIGGAHPTGIAATKDGRHAFVAMTNVDRIAVVAFDAKGRARVVGGTELRLFDRAPYGTQPTALAVSSDQKRLYVALSGLNAVAVLDVRDPARPHRVGLIPTGWSPSALALSADGRTLYVANAKGFDDETRAAAEVPTAHDAGGTVVAEQIDRGAAWATLQKIDLAGIDLPRTTRRALTYVRVARRGVANPAVPQGFQGVPSRTIKHVVLILQESKTYDAMLGDLTDAAGQPHGNGAPSLVAFGETATPNLHALARTYALATNFYADADESNAAHQFAVGGIASAFTERTRLVAHGRGPLGNASQDPEDYPRNGYIFDALSRKHLSYRVYGDLLQLSGYDRGAAPDPRTDDPAYVDAADANPPTRGLGGLYSLDVPAPAALAGHVDLDYPGWNLRVRDARRAKEFVRDFSLLAGRKQVPSYTHIWLPGSRAGAGPGVPSLAERVADSDRALGTIVEYLTHLPEWKETAIFVMSDDAESSRDHVQAHRTYALVISPYAKQRYLGARHLSTASVLKTEEELLGLPPLSLGDALAADLRDFFTSSPDAPAYVQAAPPVQRASVRPAPGIARGGAARLSANYRG